jgi:hypothetical protein
MSRRKSSDNAISLFPFLAVLVCTMGALILLLIAMTQRIHKQQLAEQAAARQQQAPAPNPTPAAISPQREPVVLPDAPTPQSVPTGPSREDLQRLADERRRQREARAQEIAEAQEAQARRVNQEWSTRTREAELQRDAELAAARRVAAERDRLLLAVQSLAQNKGGATKAIDELTDRETELEQTSATLAADASRLARTAQQIRSELELAKRKQVTGPSPYALVPYDGASGTVRRPIYIECTDVGLRFLPEGETITAADLEGFTEGFNPLLAGTVALMRYWKQRADESNGTEPEPYVLLLVRPSGSVAYYIARKLLIRLDVPFGYELIDEDWKLDVPAPDPEARKLVKTAVADALSTRDDLISATTGRGTGRRVPGGEGEFTEVDARPGGGFAGKPGSSIPGRAGTGGGPQIGVTRPIPGGPSSGTLPSPPSELPLARLSDGAGRDGQGRSLGPTGGDPGALGQSELGQSGAGQLGLDQAGRGRGARGQGGLGPDGGTSRDAAGVPTLTKNDDLAPTESELDRLPLPSEDGDWRQERAPGSEPGGPLAEGPTIGVRSGGTKNPRSAATEEKLGTLDAGRDRSVEGSGLEIARGGQAPSASGGGEPGGTSASGSKTFSEQFGPKADEYDPSARAAQAGGGSRSAGRSDGSEAVKKRWGMTNGRATIGLEKKLEIHCLPTKVLIGPNDASIPCGAGETKEQLVRDVLGAIEQLTIGWGKPPRNFYWIPVVKFVVYPGGNQHYERLQNGLREWGLFSSVEYTVRDVPKKTFSGALK